MELSIQERLKDLRVERGLTLEQLAEQTHLSKSALGSYEGDNFKDISHYALIELAKFYEVTVDYLLGRSQTKNHPNANLADLRLSDDMIELLKSGRVDNSPMFLNACNILRGRTLDPESGTAATSLNMTKSTSGMSVALSAMGSGSAVDAAHANSPLSVALWSFPAKAADASSAGLWVVAIMGGFLSCGAPWTPMPCGPVAGTF